MSDLPEFTPPPSKLSLVERQQIDMQMVRYLARQIETPQQFEEIVGQVKDPRIRQAVRDLLEPLVTFKE